MARIRALVIDLDNINYAAADDGENLQLLVPES